MTANKPCDASIYFCRAAVVSKRLVGCRSGSLAPIFGACISVLVLLIAGAIETSRWIIAQYEVQIALDAATLAAAVKLRSNKANPAAAIAEGQTAFSANIASKSVSADTVGNATFNVVDGKMVGSVSGTINSITGTVLQYGYQLGAISEVTLPNPTDKFEIALMLDITGSMCDTTPGLTANPCTSATKLNALKDAAKQLVDTVLATSELQEKVRVSIVPFSDGVRPPSALMTSIRGTKPAVSPYTYTTGSGKNTQTTTLYYHPTDCVSERFNGQAYTETAPGGANNFPNLMRQGQSQSNSTAQESLCSINASAEVLPLTNNATTLTTKINGLAAKGGTAGHLGTAWAWYTLSPTWASIWPGTSSDPAAYRTSNKDKTVRKIAVLMTDGDYNNNYALGKSGMPGSYLTNARAASTTTNGASSTQALMLCENMKYGSSPTYETVDGKQEKVEKIEVYTVGFAVSTAAATMLTTCASPGNYYGAESASDLVAVFQNIANKVVAMYISK